MLHDIIRVECYEILFMKKVGWDIDGSRQLAKLEGGCIGISVASYMYN